MNSQQDIQELENIDNQVNVQDTDFMAETVAAGLIEDGFDSEKIQIIRQGEAKRAFSKDIEKINLHFSEHDLKDYLQITTNREGIYDTLPEGLFHQTKYAKFNRDKEEVIEEIQKQRMEEFHARKFFQVFESETDYSLTLAYLNERQYDKKTNNRKYSDVFVPFWRVLELLNIKQRAIFMNAIPLLHEIRSNDAEIENTISLIMGVPVKIKYMKFPAKNADSFFESTLGKCRLGIDFVLGKMIDDGQDDVQLTVGPISAKQMEYFLETADGNAILDNLCFLFLPCDTFVKKEFDIYPEDSAFILSYGNVNTYLGINTFL
jgi:hypothetical protein